MTSITDAPQNPLPYNSRIRKVLGDVPSMAARQPVRISHIEHHLAAADRAARQRR